MSLPPTPTTSSRWLLAWPDVLAFAGGLGVAWWAKWQTRDLVWSLWLSSLVVGYATLVWLLTAPLREFLVNAFAPVASGDPYGWVRDCTPRAGDRANVFGVGLDAETRRNISEPGACDSSSWPNEKPWDGADAEPKPPFRVFHHAQDGINDRSCVDKVRQQLTRRGWPEAAPFTLSGGPRSAEAHYWQHAYNAPLLAWLGEQLRR